MNHQLDCLALKLLVVSLLYLLLFHGLSHFTLRFRVRQIGGGSGARGHVAWSAKLKLLCGETRSLKQLFVHRADDGAPRPGLAPHG
jgi:hypothetical protein